MYRRLVVLTLAMLLVSSTAYAHDGEWTWRQVCGMGICWGIPSWREHDHNAGKTIPECEERCYEKYMRCLEYAWDSGTPAMCARSYTDCKCDELCYFEWPHFVPERFRYQYRMEDIWN